MGSKRNVFRGLEPLEHRNYLSTTGLVEIEPLSLAARQAAIPAYVGALPQTQQVGPSDLSFRNIPTVTAQVFFSVFINNLHPAASPTTPAAPTTPVNSTGPAIPYSPPPSPLPPPPPPPPPPANTTPVSVSTVNMGSFNELVVVGTSDNDSIFVTQSGVTLTVTGNGNTQDFTGPFGDLVIKAGAGNDNITIDPSVNIAALIYGGTGNSQIVAQGSGKTTIVTLGAGHDTVTGNGINTSYWVDTTDVVSASSAETAAGNVHRIAAFYQPWSSSPTNADYVPLTLNGQTLRMPSALTATTTRLVNHSLWGTGPVINDVNQGQSSDCYFLADLQALTTQAPGKLQNLAVDLGDGTYAVQFDRNGTITYVRVDGRLPAGGAYANGLYYAHPGSTGDIWVPILEKAYAFFRTAANSYPSLDSGWTGDVFDDFGISNTTVTITGNASTVYNQLHSALVAGRGVTISTESRIGNGVPLIVSHSYSLVSVVTSSSAGLIFTLRNPWGFDGAGNDANPNDALVQVTLAQIESNAPWASIMT